MKNTRNNTKVQTIKALNSYLLEVEVEAQHIASAETRIDKVLIVPFRHILMDAINEGMAGQDFDYDYYE